MGCVDVVNVEVGRDEVRLCQICGRLVDIRSHLLLRLIEDFNRYMMRVG